MHHHQHQHQQHYRTLSVSVTFPTAFKVSGSSSRRTHTDPRHTHTLDSPLCVLARESRKPFLLQLLLFMLQVPRRRHTLQRRHKLSHDIILSLKRESFCTDTHCSVLLSFEARPHSASELIASAQRPILQRERVRRRRQSTLFLFSDVSVCLPHFSTPFYSSLSSCVSVWPA